MKRSRSGMPATSPVPAELPSDFDEALYLAANSDVRSAVSSGAFASGAAHYLSYGHREGRSLRPVLGQNGLPLPSPDLIFLVTHGHDPAQFEATGAADKHRVQQAVREAGASVPEGRRYRVLDWGCGCGRLARHWAGDANVDLFGCDINETLVAWCRDNLTFGTFTVSLFDPPLDFPDGFFDVIYAISVLTHLTFEQHYRWMRELHRLLAPGGVIVLTVHGPTMFPQILIGAKAAFESADGKVRTHLIDGDAFVCLEHAAGSNSTGNVLTGTLFGKIFQPFDVRLHQPRYGLMGIHDTYVLTKKSGRDLTFVEHLAEVALTGIRFRHVVDLALDGQTSFAVLAGVRALFSSARLTLGLSLPGEGERTVSSRAVRLFDKVDWTFLDDDYALVAIDNIPPHRGAASLTIDVEGSAPLDGARLTLSRAVMF